MTANWKNLYPAGSNHTTVASESPEAVFRLAETLLETVGMHDGSMTRSGMLEAVAIVESVLISLEHTADTGVLDADFHDINSNTGKSEIGTSVRDI